MLQVLAYNKRMCLFRNFYSNEEENRRFADMMIPKLQNGLDEDEHGNDADKRMDAMASMLQSALDEKGGREGRQQPHGKLSEVDTDDPAMMRFGRDLGQQFMRFGRQ